MSWIDYNHVLSFNKPLNFVVTSRGYGKTFGFKILAIENFIKHKKHFVYMKRYRDDMKKVKRFFTGEIASLYPDYEFLVKSNFSYIRKIKEEGEYIEGWKELPWEIFGFFIPLSSWQKEKGDNYDDVTLICYDEFIKEKDTSRYLADEGRAFRNQLDTIIRLREDVKIFCLGNMSSIFNPLFIEYDVFIPKGAKIVRADIYLVYMKVDESYIEKRKDSLIGKLTYGSAYDQFATHNEAYMDSDSLVGASLDGGAIYKGYIKCDKDIMGMWISNREMVLSSKFSHVTNTKITLDIDELEEDEKFIDHYKAHMSTLLLQRYFEAGKLKCEKMRDRQQMMQILKKLKIIKV